MSSEPTARSDRWARLWRIPRAWWWLGIPLGGLGMFAAGIVFWGGLHWAVELTNTETFCVSCHEMRDNVYEEYKKTVHYHNRTGVRASCPDCHVPKVWAYKMERKIRATFNELPKHVLGELDTPEKFEAHRLMLAEDVWKIMKESDSRECRNCHALDHMDLEAQDKSAQRKHTLEYQQQSGKTTCIDCHKGIAHKLPDVAGADSGP